MTALCALGLLYTFPYHPKIGNPNEKLRLYMSAAIAEEGTYAVNTFRKRWKWVNDAALVDGKFYSVKAPATSFLGVPAYFAYYKVQHARGKPVDLGVAHWLLRVTAVILPVLLFLFFFHRWLLSFTTRAWLADAVTLGLGLASPFYAYALMFVSHSLAAIATFVAFAKLRDAYREKQRQASLSDASAPRPTLGTASSFLAGLATAGVTAFEYPGVLLSLAFSGWALFVVRPLRRLVAFAAGGLVPTLAVMHFQYKAFGSPFRPGHKLLENKHFVAGHEEGLFGASYPKLEGLAGLTLDPRQGLFPLAPWMLLAFVGFVLLVRRREERVPAWVTIACCALLYLFTASLNIWHAGWSVGPRYLIPLLPWLAWAALVGFDHLADRRPRLTLALLLGTLATAFIASGIPSAYYPHIPTDTQRMLRDLFWPALRHDFAPYNALNLLGVWGTASMVPLFVLFAGCLVFIGVAAVREEPSARAGLAFAPLVLVVSLLPVLSPAWQKTGSVDHVLRNWSPDHRDKAALLEAEMRTEPTRAGLEELLRLYAEEGRKKEHKRVTRRLRALDEKERAARERPGVPSADGGTP